MSYQFALNGSLTSVQTVKPTESHFIDKYVPASLLSTILNRRAVLIQAPMGSGKTYTTINALRHEFSRVIVLTHRVSLLHKIKSDFYPRILQTPYNNDSFKLTTEDTICCVESLKNLRTSPVTPYILLVDEIVDFLRHLFNTPLLDINQKILTLEKFNQLVLNSEKVIFLSADATPNFATALIANYPIFDGGYYQFKYKEPALFPLFYVPYKGTNFMKGTLFLACIADVITQFEGLPNLLISLNSQKIFSMTSVHVVKAFLEQKGYEKILIIDSEASKDESSDAHEIASNLSQLKAYQAVIHTSSITSGVSIDFSHFDFHLINSQGLEFHEIVQSSYRLRDETPRILIHDTTAHPLPPLTSLWDTITQSLLHEEELPHNPAASTYQSLSLHFFAYKALTRHEPQKYLQQAFEQVTPLLDASELTEQLATDKDKIAELELFRISYVHRLKEEFNSNFPTSDTNTISADGDFEVSSTNSTALRLMEQLVKKTGISSSKWQLICNGKVGLILDKLVKAFGSSEYKLYCALNRSDDQAYWVLVDKVLGSPKAVEYFKLGLYTQLPTRTLLFIFYFFGKEMDGKELAKLIQFPEFKPLQLIVPAKALLSNSNFQSWILTNCFGIKNFSVKSVKNGVKHTEIILTKEVLISHLITPTNAMVEHLNQLEETARFRLDQLKLRMLSGDYKSFIGSSKSHSLKASFVQSSYDNAIQNHIPTPFNTAKKVSFLSPSQMANNLTKLDSQPVIFDTETFCPFKTKTGALSRFYNVIRLVQIGFPDSNEVWICDLGGRDFNDLDGLRKIMHSLEKHQLIGHNLVFDISSCLSSSGVALDCFWDTRIALQVLHGVNSGREIGLAFGLKQYVKWLWKLDFPELGNSDWGLQVLPSEQLEYAADDIVLTRNLYHLTKYLIERPFLLGNPTDSATLKTRLVTEFGIIKPLAKSETKGAFLEEKWFSIEAKLKGEFEVLSNSFITKYGHPFTKLQALTQPFRTADEALSKKYRKGKDFILNCPQMKEIFTDYQLLMDMFQYLSRLQTIMSNLDSKGCFHWEISTLTGAGRMAYSSGASSGKGKVVNPNSIPKSVPFQLKAHCPWLPGLREAFTPPDDLQLVDNDLGAAHLKIAASYTGCEVTTKMLNEDADGHSAVGLRILNALHSSNCSIFDYSQLQEFCGCDPDSPEILARFKKLAKDKNHHAFELRQAAKRIYSAINGGNPYFGCSQVLNAIAPGNYSKWALEIEGAFDYYSKLFPSIRQLILKASKPVTKCYNGLVTGNWVDGFFISSLIHPRTICSRLWQTGEATIMKNSILELSASYDIFIINHDSLGCLVEPSGWENACYEVSDAMYRHGRAVTGVVHPGSASAEELKSQGTGEFVKSKLHWN